MEHKFINEIEPGQAIDDVYLVREPVLRSTTRGDLYIAMYLCDKTGQLNARMWQATEQTYKLLPQPGFIHINGRSELYQNNLQIVVNNARVVEPSQVNLDDFLARTDKDVDKLFAEIRRILGTIKNTQLRALLEEFISDEGLMAKFRKAPAAIKLHHNYLGGLIEHTHNTLLVAQAVLPFYPEVQPDLVLAGIFLHDMGKTEELSYEMSFGYTDSGQLIGHIAKTLLMIHKKADSLAAGGTQIDQGILDALGHIVLSHHGQYEFGSPKLPATAEAFMVSYIDDMDAKIKQVRQAIDRELSDSSWTVWQGALQTRIYKRQIDQD
jgi:3'-5' exoribonuclease